MKSWYKLQADENRIMNKHYTKGRGGYKIEFVVVHHNGSNLSIAQIYNVWQTRPASAHYQVDQNGLVGQLVWDSNTAWHCGNASGNRRSIGVEHANNRFAPQWTVSDDTLENGAHLVAAICKKHGLGRPKWMKNVFPHSYFSSTSCPGALSRSQNKKYMSRARAWYKAMNKGKTLSKPKPKRKPKPKLKVSSKSVNTLAKEVIAGKHGTGATRRKSLGSQYTAVQKRVNKLLTGKKSKPTVNIDQLARDTIRGKYGNGAERKRRLGRNYRAVQRRINQIL